MVFTNVVNPRSHVSRKHEYQRTLVKRGATHRRERDGRVRPHDRPLRVHRRRRGRDEERAGLRAGRRQPWTCHRLDVRVRRQAGRRAEAACAMRRAARAARAFCREAECSFARNPNERRRHSRERLEEGVQALREAVVSLPRHVRTASAARRRLHRTRGARRRRPRDPARREGRDHRPERRRQEHAVEADHERDRSPPPGCWT